MSSFMRGVQALLDFRINDLGTFKYFVHIDLITNSCTV